MNSADVKVALNDSNSFASIVDHSNTSMNKEATADFSNFFDGRGRGTPFEDMNVVGNGKVSFHSRQFHPQDAYGGDDDTNVSKSVKRAAGTSVQNSTDSGTKMAEPNYDNQPSKTGETGVWVIEDAILCNFHKEIMREVNLLLFLGSSDEVGASVKSKARYYRASTAPGAGGLFQLSSDPKLIECDDMYKVESRLVDLVSHLMETQDRLVAQSNPNKKMCRWVPNKTMCQMTVGTMKDSAYKNTMTVVFITIIASPTQVLLQLIQKSGNT